MRQTLTVPTRPAAQADPQSDPLVALAALPGVASSIAAAQAAVDVVLGGLPRRRVSADQTRDALVATTLASADGEADPSLWRAGCERLGGELVTLAPQIRVAPGAVLARIHLLLARGVADEVDLGRIGAGVDTGRLAGLTRLLTTQTAAPSTVLAAVTHAELVQLQPFGAGSGLVARAVEHLVLLEAKIDPVGMIMIERAHVEDAVAYAAARSAYAGGTPLGLTHWLRHCSEALARGAELSPLAAR